jgi:hypothetical protein
MEPRSFCVCTGEEDLDLVVPKGVKLGVGPVVLLVANCRGGDFTADA